MIKQPRCLDARNSRNETQRITSFGRLPKIWGRKTLSTMSMWPSISMKTRLQKILISMEKAPCEIHVPTVEVAWSDAVKMQRTPSTRTTFGLQRKKELKYFLKRRSGKLNLSTESTSFIPGKQRESCPGRIGYSDHGVLWFQEV